MTDSETGPSSTTYLFGYCPDARHRLNPRLHELLIAIAMPAYGQDVGADWKVGMRARLTSMTIKSDIGGTVDRRVGLSAGAFTTVGLPGPFALQPELLYVQKGAVLNTPRVLQDGTLVGVE